MTRKNSCVFYLSALSLKVCSTNENSNKEPLTCVFSLFAPRSQLLFIWVKSPPTKESRSIHSFTRTFSRSIKGAK